MTQPKLASDGRLDPRDIWARLAAPLPADAIQWRQSGRPISRDGKHYARFVAFVDAQFVRERLDSVVPGEWDSELTLLPPPPAKSDRDGVSVEEDEPIAFKCKLTILGVVREDVGTGRDYKTAASDALKRAAVRFGVASELYSLEQNFVQIDGDGKYAKPLEDPAVAYARRYGKGEKQGTPSSGAVSGEGEQRSDPTTGSARSSSPRTGRSDSDPTNSPLPSNAGPRAMDEPTCPKCGGRTWDNRASKRNPRAPDYKCRDRSCDGVIWPPRPAVPAKPARADEEFEDFPSVLTDDDEEIPL